MAQYEDSVACTATYTNTATQLREVLLNARRAVGGGWTLQFAPSCQTHSFTQVAWALLSGSVNIFPTAPWKAFKDVFRNIKQFPVSRLAWPQGKALRDDFALVIQYVEKGTLHF
jgi:hypothetical protein